MNKELLAALDLISQQTDKLNDLHSKSLTFQKVKDCPPQLNSLIWYIKVNRFYGDYEIKCGRVDYLYEELDSDGEYTGTTYYNEPTSDKIKYQQYIVVNDYNLSDNTLWCYADTVEKMLERQGCFEES